MEYTDPGSNFPFLVTLVSAFRPIRQMVHPIRHDEPGAWHHVTNRGLEKRAIFGTHEDARQFLSQLTNVVRRGWIEIHAYSLLTTHFHLLVRSLEGKLSLAMFRLQQGYVRWFNQRYLRDGPLFKGRFWSQRIESDTYIHTVIRYIDQNAVNARLVYSSQLYPFSSAWHYAGKNGPPWLSRSVIEGIVQSWSRKKHYDHRDYFALFGTALTDGEVELVERRLRARKKRNDPLDYLKTVPSTRLRGWLLRKTKTTDGSHAHLPVLSPDTVLRIVNQRSGNSFLWQIDWNGRSLSAWPILLSGIFRNICGLTIKEIALRIGCCLATVQRRVDMHAHLLSMDEKYAKTATQVVRVALEKDWGKYMQRQQEL